jgi:hypothetical protein
MLRSRCRSSPNVKLVDANRSENLGTATKVRLHTKLLVHRRFDTLSKTRIDSHHPFGRWRRNSETGRWHGNSLFNRMAAMCRGGSAARRFHRHLADRRPAPSTAATEPADRKLVRLLPVSSGRSDIRHQSPHRAECCPPHLGLKAVWHAFFLTYCYGVHAASTAAPFALPSRRPLATGYWPSPRAAHLEGQVAAPCHSRRQEVHQLTADAHCHHRH